MVLELYLEYSTKWLTFMTHRVIILYDALRYDVSLVEFSLGTRSC